MGHQLGEKNRDFICMYVQMQQGKNRDAEMHVFRRKLMYVCGGERKTKESKRDSRERKMMKRQ